MSQLEPLPEDEEPKHRFEESFLLGGIAGIGAVALATLTLVIVAALIAFTVPLLF